MRSLSLQGLPDKRRQKVLVPDWPDPEGPSGNEVKTRTIYTGVTNGTERNQLIGGNYAPADSELPTGGNGYQNVGKVIEVGTDVCELKIGDVLYMSAAHAEYAVMPEDGLLVKLPGSMDLPEAALLGICSVAMRSCRNAELSVGERVLIVGSGFPRTSRRSGRRRHGRARYDLRHRWGAADDREGDRRGGNRVGCFGGAMDAECR